MGFFRIFFHNTIRVFASRTTCEVIVYFGANKFTKAHGSVKWDNFFFQKSLWTPFTFFLVESLHEIWIVKQTDNWYRHLCQLHWQVKSNHNRKSIILTDNERQIKTFLRIDHRLWWFVCEGFFFVWQTILCGNL